MVSGKREAGAPLVLWVLFDSPDDEVLLKVVAITSTACHK